MTRRYLGKWPGVAGLAAAALLLLPEAAFAQDGAALAEAVKTELDNLDHGRERPSRLHAGRLPAAGDRVLRGKNVGTGVAKIFVNLGVVSFAW